MSTRFLRERRRESRLHAFGLALGLVLALLFHLMLFWGPRVSYRPLLETGRVRRVLIARPYVPRPSPAPPVEPGRAATPETEAAPPARTPVPQQSMEEPRAPAPAAPRREVTQEAPAGELPAAGTVGPSPQEEPAPELSPDAWSAMMAELAQRGQSLGDRMRREGESASDSATRGRGLQGEGQGEEGFLDPRIRVKVVSYPPTSIEGAYPTIPYPDLRLHRSQLTAGICRVYYRVWTDGSGRVVRDQIKSPATREERERYAPFVEAVTSEVASWPFDPVKAEVHVDVLFEIE